MSCDASFLFDWMTAERAINITLEEPDNEYNTKNFNVILTKRQQNLIDCGDFLLRQGNSVINKELLNLE